MGKNRLEAFCDGIITIMMLELKVPHGAEFRVLLPLWPVFMSYVLSFIYIGIYWNKRQYGLPLPRAVRIVSGCGIRLQLEKYSGKCWAWHVLVSDNCPSI